MAVGAGQFDRKVTFYRYAETPGRGEIAQTRNTLNEVVRSAPFDLAPNSEVFCTAWARREDLSAQEKVAEGAQDAVLKTRWFIRSTSKTRQLAARDVMVADGRSWHITEGPKESLRAGRHRLLEFTAAEMA